MKRIEIIPKEMAVDGKPCAIEVDWTLIYEYQKTGLIHGGPRGTGVYWGDENKIEIHGGAARSADALVIGRMLIACTGWEAESLEETLSGHLRWRFKCHTVTITPGLTIAIGTAETRGQSTFTISQSAFNHLGLGFAKAVAALTGKTVHLTQTSGQPLILSF